MKLMPVVGLIKIECDEWSEVKAALLATGYRWDRLKGTKGHFELWTADLLTCVSCHSTEDSCYWLDIRVLSDLKEGKKLVTKLTLTLPSEQKLCIPLTDIAKTVACEGGTILTTTSGSQIIVKETPGEILNLALEADKAASEYLKSLQDAVQRGFNS